MIKALRRAWRRLVAWSDWRKPANGPKPWKSWED
jgi:hypothetical protein